MNVWLQSYAPGSQDLTSYTRGLYRGPDELCSQSEDTSNIDCYFFENSDDVPNPKELNPEDKNIMLFDDLLLEKQNACEKYYARGRHSNVDCFYLSQNYFNSLDKLSERMQISSVCFDRQDL